MKIVALGIVASALAIGAPSGQRITKVSNVRLRTSPALEAPVDAELPLGTTVTIVETGTAAEWDRVETSDHRTGWVFRQLTAPFEPSRAVDIVEGIVRDRLPAGPREKWRWNVGGQSFAASEQLVALIENTEPGISNAEQRGRFAYYRLQALDAALARIREKQMNVEPYRSWIAAHQGVAALTILGGPILSLDVIWRAHDEQRASSSADDIAWFAVQVGLGGECEGDIICYVHWQNLLNGEYLRRQPSGRHVPESVRKITVHLNGALDNVMSYPRVFAEFNSAKACAELRSFLDPLLAAVAGSGGADKAPALDAIERYAKLCR